MPFRKLRDRNGSPAVTLDKDHLRRDGVLDADGSIPDDRQLLVERVEEGAYLVRVIESVEEIPEAGEVLS